MGKKDGANVMRQVYLDNAATTPLLPEVIEAVNDAMVHYANPSSLHSLGAGAEKLVRASRAEVAGLLDVKPAEIYFTSGGTEANNLAIKGLLARSGRRGRLITSRIEHPSVLAVFRELEREGWDVQYIPVDDGGSLSLAALEEALAEPVLLVSIMAVNNETGTVQPIKEIVNMVREKQPQAVIHCDAVQAPGKIPFSPKELGIDMVSLSAHKIHGPKGVGALFLARQGLIRALLEGGGQEGGLRSGTENVPGIAGFGRAAGLARDFQRGLDWVTRLRSRFEEGLADFSCRVISPSDGVPHILAVTFPGFRGEILLQALSKCGIYVSTGAACSGKKGHLSHVAGAMGLDEDSIHGLLRFSFSRLNTSDEIDYALGKLKQVLEDLAFVRGRRGH